MQADLHPGGNAGSSAAEIIHYQFASPLPAGSSFLLWAPGAVVGTDHGPLTFGFSASDGAAAVSTAGWTFAVENPFNMPLNGTYTVDPTTGVVTVANFTAAQFPQAVVVATTNQPIDGISVVAKTIAYDAWGLAVAGSAPCFLCGTHLMSRAGPVAVETVAPGVRLLTRFAGEAEVIWVGRRTIDARRHRDPGAVWPVRILRNAVAPGVPCRDLLLSPDHAVFLGGVLIPVKYLVNGRTILQDRSVRRIEYYHVELNRHDVLLAEALPVESYLDTGNRGGFENATAAITLHPAFGPCTWEADACAPLWGEGGPAEHIRALLQQRADAGGTAWEPEASAARLG